MFDVLRFPNHRDDYTSSSSGSSARLRVQLSTEQPTFVLSRTQPPRARRRGGGRPWRGRVPALPVLSRGFLGYKPPTFTAINQHVYSSGNTTFWATVNRDWAKLYIVQHEILHCVEQQSPWYSLIEPTNDLQYNVSKMKVLWQTAESNISLHLNVLMTSCDTSKFKESNKSGNEKSDPYCGVRGWPLVVGVEWRGGGATMATIVGGQVFVLPR